MRIFFILIMAALSLASHAQEQLVEAGGNSFHVYTKGLAERKPGTPLIIFENGMGVDLSNWDKVINEIAAFAPVFAYDRAGIGKSGKMFRMPAPRVVAEDLHGILRKMNIAPPYLLVGHSLGGVYIRGFSGYYPDEVAGLVFVDPADFTETKNDWNDIFRKLGLPETKIEQMLRDRLYQPVTKIDSANYGPWSERLALNEMRKSDFKELSALPLPGVTVYFFVGGKFDVPPAQRSKEYDQEKFFHIKNDSNMKRWRQLVHSSAKGGAVLYLTNAGHYIQWDDPRSLIENIRIIFSSIQK